jgi:hypothetical protein
VQLGVLAPPSMVIDGELVFAKLPSAAQLRDELALNVNGRKSPPPRRQRVKREPRRVTYSQVRNIGDRWMLEERAHELRVSSNLRELFVNPWPQLFALLQRASCDAGALDVAPHQLIRIEVRRVTGQEVQSK